MTIGEFQEILNGSGFGDILYEESWSEDYTPEINFTVKELKDIANTIDRSASEVNVEALVMPKIAEDETNKEYWRKRLRERYDPVIAFRVADDSPYLPILKEVAEEEGALHSYRATEGYLKGMFIIIFSGLYK